MINCAGIASMSDAEFLAYADARACEWECQQREERERRAFTERQTTARVSLQPN